MKKTTLIFLLLVVISTILIAGCTQVKTLPAPAPLPAVTAVPTYVQNQQGVAIFRTVNVTASPTVAVTQTFEVNIAKTVVVKTDQTISNVTNKTEQKIANLTK
jgi:hypothetical protein